MVLATVCRMRRALVLGAAGGPLADAGRCDTEAGRGKGQPARVRVRHARQLSPAGARYTQRGARRRQPTAAADDGQWAPGSAPAHRRNSHRKYILLSHTFFTAQDPAFGRAPVF